MDTLAPLATLAQQLFVIALPILAVFVAALLYANIKNTLRKADEQLDWTYKLTDAAEFAVQAAEQYLRSEDGQKKKLYALEVAERFLSSHGIKLDLALISDAIEKEVWIQLNQGRDRSGESDAAPNKGA